jgi:hypothetical protein
MINKFSLFLITMLLYISVSAQKPAIFSTEEGAIKGYDPVAYFNDSAAVKGLDSFSYEWQNATWKFSSAANRKKFIADPVAYAPAYGGYCAFGVSGNYKAPVSADAWSIVNGKLYLNYNKQVQANWKKDVVNRIALAEKNWPALKDK